MDNKLELISTQDLLGRTVNYVNTNDIKVERLNTNFSKTENVQINNKNETKFDDYNIKKERLASICFNNSKSNSSYEIVKLKLF